MSDDELLCSIANQAADRRYGWTRQMLTLATGMLTALIALQKTFVPSDALCLWLLQACWSLLTLGIVLCAVHLAGDYQAYKSAGERLQQALNDESKSQTLVAYPGKASLRAFAIYPWVLLAAVVCLSAFAILNIGRTTI